MPEKPRQFGSQYASIWQDASVVAAYHLRPPYPPETFSVLVGLIPPDAVPRRVLDAGCGTGYIARPLADYVDHVDAVDIAERMIEMAKTQPGGDRPNITWITGPIETIPLHGPYALIVAAASLHWMDWDRALPRFAGLLVPNGVLALVEEIHPPYPWDEQTTPIVSRHSMNKDFVPYSMATIAEQLEQRGLFELFGSRQTEPAAFQQPLEAFIRSFHARNGFSLDRMGKQAAEQFGAEMRAAVQPYAENGIITLQVAARILWGRPR